MKPPTDVKPLPQQPKFPPKEETSKVEAKSNFVEAGSPKQPKQNIIAKATDDEDKPPASVEDVTPVKKFVPKRLVTLGIFIGYSV